MAGLDWAATGVGAVETWPASLRFAVRTVLASRFPMVLTWGPGFLQFYNDAYAPLIGAKHPAIGHDIRDTLAEGWDALSGPVEQAMTTREASWLPRLPLLLERDGYREETYFTVSHAPAFGDDGAVAGMHAVCTEVTAEVVAERRQAVLRALTEAGHELADDEVTAARLCAALAVDALDVPFAGVWLTRGGRLRRIATVGCPAGALPEEAAWADLPTDVSALGLTGGLWGDPVRDAVVLPLHTPGGDGPTGALLLAVTPARRLDEDLRDHLSLVASQFAAALAVSEALAAERHRAEALAELDRAKTAFFSDISHELRTPLTLLLGPLEDVLADPGAGLTGTTRDGLALALRNGQRLERLVDDVMDVVRLEAGAVVQAPQPVDLAAFTAELAGVLRAAAERAGLSLHVDCPPLPAPVLVDPRIWEKVVLNLVANAVKYTFVGHIDVVLRTVGEVPGTGPLPLELTVRDTGIGIPAAEQARVFDRFHRVLDARARTREGTGIGLSLVRDLVQLLGGEVTVDSAPGRGSTFTARVDLPAAGFAAEGRAPSAAARGTAAAWERDLTAPVGPAPAGDDRGSVLVVDDNADMRDYLARLLSPRFRVLAAADGEQALALAAGAAPDVLVTDVMMPRVDGFDLLRRLRADPATADVPVLVLTARAGQEAAVETLDAGADDHLAKPFRSAELVARVTALASRPHRRALGRGVQTAPAPPPAPARAATPAAAGDLGGPAAGTSDGPPTGTGTTDGPPTGTGTTGMGTTGTGTSGTGTTGTGHSGHWRLAATDRAPARARAALRPVLEAARIHEDQAYDLLVAVGEAVTNAVEHAQRPTEPVVDLRIVVDEDVVVATVTDTGQWRERVSSMDRGRGSTLMAAVGEVSVLPGAEGTTVTIRAERER
ncbi:Signal transduction histidine kinase [Klenkia marina]|uniref:histidine kinase n=1 Tax=Klenkia marina TaxID=1960309 RepID=A0A1G4YLC4_9ACTN|nr:ATP-binding protein [Klenkia marina]SCX54253.1 Signal transduction histidine kinase [Klenkia marina]